MAGVFSIMIQKCFVKKNNQNLVAKPDYITLIDTEMDNNFEDKRKRVTIHFPCKMTFSRAD